MYGEPIYIVTDQGPATGIGTYAEGLARLLRLTLPRVEVLSLCYFPVEPRLGWVRLPGARNANSILDIPSVLHHNYRLMRATLPADSAVHFCGASYGLVSHYPRSVVTVHDYYPRRPALGNAGDPWVIARDLSSLWQFIKLPRQVRSALSIVVPTRSVQECLRQLSSLESVVIPHWIDPDRFRPRDKRSAREELGLPVDEHLVLNVSTGSSNKNYALLTKVASNLGKGFRMVAAGGRHLIPAKSIRVPRLTHELYPLLFDACDVYLHTSIQEGFGWPLIEAMASQLPVVALRTNVAMEVLGRGALFVNLGDPITRWIAAIEHLADDRIRAEVIAREKSRLTLFDPDTALHRYQTLYQTAFEW